MFSRSVWLGPSIFARVNAGRQILSWAILAFAFGGALPANAGMGESDVTAGLEETRDNRLTFGCTLGNACLGENGVQYRLFSADLAGQVFRGGDTIETDKDINGIGFGSLVSTQQSTPATLDTLCWSGTRTKNSGNKLSQGFRDCMKIFSGSGRSASCSSSVIRTSQSGDNCASVEAAFADPPSPNPQFKYLIKLDPTSFGKTNAVEVIRCESDIVAQCADPTTLGSNLTVKAQTAMAAYDCVLYRYGRCLY
jgi:hypothetical protein